MRRETRQDSHKKFSQFLDSTADEVHNDAFPVPAGLRVGLRTSNGHLLEGKKKHKFRIVFKSGRENQLKKSLSLIDSDTFVYIYILDV